MQQIRNHLLIKPRATNYTQLDFIAKIIGKFSVLNSGLKYISHLKHMSPDGIIITNKYSPPKDIRFKSCGT